MIEQVKSIIKSKKTVFANFGYLSLLQLFTLVIPLITYPYLIGVLGAECWGQIIFAQTIVFYFMTVIQFGFNMSATRRISMAQGDQKKLSQIVSSVYILKACLLILCFIVLCILLVSIPSLRKDIYLYLLSFLVCLGDVLFPIWYFQGIEKMKYITIIQFIAKLFFVGLIFVFIHSKTDYLLVPLLNGVGSIIGGMIAFVIVFKKHNLVFVTASIKYLKELISESSYFFTTSLSIVLTARLNIILLGSFVGLREVAYYDVALKLVSLAKTPFLMINQALYPSLSRSFNSKHFYKMIMLFLALSLCGYFGVAVFGEWAVQIIGGKEMLPAYAILLILALDLPLASVSSVMGIILASQGFAKYYMRADIYTFLIYCALISVLIIFNLLTIYTMIFAMLLGIAFGIPYKYKQILNNHILENKNYKK